MLTIKNWDTLIGETFMDGRFLFSNFVETGTKLKFWFKDLDDKIPAGGVWVEIEREGIFDFKKGYKLYRVTYPRCPEHKIGAHYFGDIDNVKWTFETALKKQP